MEMPATFQTRVAKTLAGALVGAVVGYGAIHLAGFGATYQFAFFGAIIGAGIALGVPSRDLNDLDDPSEDMLQHYLDEESERMGGRGIYADDDH